MHVRQALCPLSHIPAQRLPLAAFNACGFSLLQSPLFKLTWPRHPAWHLLPREGCPSFRPVFTISTHFFHASFSRMLPWWCQGKSQSLVSLASWLSVFTFLAHATFIFHRTVFVKALPCISQPVSPLTSFNSPRWRPSRAC